MKYVYGILLVIITLVSLAVVYPIRASHVLLYVLTGFDSNFMKIDRCLDSGGAWLHQWEKCAYTNDEIREYCESLSLVEFEKFHCGAKLGS